MTRQEHLQFCNKCVNRKFDSNLGLICSLTDHIADFEVRCDKFIIDNSVKDSELQMEDSDPAGATVSGELDETSLLKLKSHQDFNFALVGGAVATLLSAILWAVITITAKYQIGYMAIGVGLLVGFAVKYFGAGIDKKFGFLGAGFALLGCLLGNLFSQIGFAAQEESVGFMELIPYLNFGIIVSILTDTFNPIDLVFYGLATYEGYRFAFRSLPNDLINKLKSADFDGEPLNNKLRLPLVIAGIVAISVFIFVITRGVNGHKMYHYESGMKQSEGELKDSKPDGKWTTWYENGQLMSEGFFISGMMDSSWTWYYENGNLKKTGKFRKDLENGVMITYYPEGQIVDSGNYVDGRKNGMWISRFENGKLNVKGNYKRDLQDGEWEFYFENGKLLSKGIFKNSDLAGKWDYYYPNGQLAHNIEYQPDKKELIVNSYDSTGKFMVTNGNGIFNEYYTNGTISQTGNVVNGLKEGIWRQYYENGKLKQEGAFENEIQLVENYWDMEGKQVIKNGSGIFIVFFPESETMSDSGEIKNGYRTGLWKTFHLSTGNVFNEIHYEKGILNGIQKQYYESGMLASEGLVTNNLKEGEWNWYSEAGMIESKVTFKHDKKEGKQTMWNDSGEILKEEYYENGNFVRIQTF